jgi:hypothetical protein
VGNAQSAINHEHKYFPSTPSHLKVPTVKKHWNQKPIIACLHPYQYWVEQQELLFVDERNLHSQDNENHCLHQEDNQHVTWQTQKPPPP